jgi:glycosyltransferase involved in cell wall biosynthesis
MDKKKRILIAADRFLPRRDGISIFLDLLIPELAKYFEVDVLVPDFKGKTPSYFGVNVRKIPLFMQTFGKLHVARPELKKISDAVKRADVVFVQMIGPVGFFSSYFAKKNNKKIINYVHCVEWDLAEKLVANFKSLVGFFVKKLAKYCYLRSSLLLLPSKKIGRILLENGIKTKSRVIRLGIDSDRFIPPASKELAKKKIGISTDFKVIGFVGRIGTLEKDVPTLLSAFFKLKKKFSNVKLLLVGEVFGSDFPKDKDIIYAGEQKDVVSYLQAMDIFVMPSLIETSSLATMEAMSCGCAVVSTPVGSIPEYLVEDFNGLFFRPGNSVSLMNKLNFLLSDFSRCRSLGINARKTILERYLWKDTIKKIVSVLKE